MLFAECVLLCAVQSAGDAECYSLSAYTAVCCTVCCGRRVLFAECVLLCAAGYFEKIGQPRGVRSGRRSQISSTIKKSRDAIRMKSSMEMKKESAAAEDEDEAVGDDEGTVPVAPPGETDANQQEETPSDDRQSSQSTCAGQAEAPPGEAEERRAGPCIKAEGGPVEDAGGVAPPEGAEAGAPETGKRKKTRKKSVLYGTRKTTVYTARYK